MNYKTRYTGSFLTQKGEQITVEIQVREDLYTPPVGGTAQLRFPAGSPAVISWESREKEEPMQGSSLTLKIESPGDRTYLDLYTVEPAAVRACIYRNGSPFWLGTLDPEFYEEPYERADKYDVSLTFTDFGPLQRFKPSTDLPDTPNVMRYISDAMEKIGLDSLQISMNADTLLLTDENALVHSRIRVSNFTDEDGETMNYDEILTSLLQPLGVRMIQREGSLVLYTLNYMADPDSPVETVPVRWSGERQTLSTDRVANKVKITFSPYGESTLLDYEIKAEDVEGCINNVTTVNVWDSLDSSKETEEEVEIGQGEYLDGFTFVTGPNNGNFSKAMLPDSTMLFYNIPELTDTNDAGIALRFPRYAEISDALRRYCAANYPHREPWYGLGNFSGNYSDYIDCDPKLGGIQNPFMCTYNGPINTWRKPTELFHTNPMVLRTGKGQLRITLPVIFHSAYNPFVSSAEYNGSLWWRFRNSDGSYGETKVFNSNEYANELKYWYSFVYVPVKIVLHGVDGSTWHYVNSLLAAPMPGESIYTSRFQHSSDRCYWAKGEGDWNECFLCYYDFNTRYGDTGIGKSAWTENRPICYNYTDTLPSSWDKKGAGEFIDLPPVDGDLIIYVGTGIAAFNEEIAVNGMMTRYAVTPVKGPVLEATYTNAADLFLRWMLYQLPKVQLVDPSTGDELQCDDIEYTGTVNEQAQEDVEIDTVCGTGAPSFARGIYLYENSSTGATEPIVTMKRAGRVDCPEQLLIGTLFSQYHTRCIMLSGEMDIPSSRKPLMVYTDAATPESRFMMKGEVMDLITGTTDATLVEVRPDNWTAD